MSLIVFRQTMTARENLRMAEAMRNAKDTAVSASGAKMQFLANVSHDLRTPLNGVLGCAQILKRDKTLGAKQKELVRTMQSCAEHLRQLITDLLDLSKLEANKLKLILQPFDLRVMLDGLIKTFWLEAQNKGISLELAVQGPVSRTGSKGTRNASTRSWATSSITRSSSPRKAGSNWSWPRNRHHHIFRSSIRVAVSCRTAWPGCSDRFPNWTSGP